MEERNCVCVCVCVFVCVCVCVGGVCEGGGGGERESLPSEWGGACFFSVFLSFCGPGKKKKTSLIGSSSCDGQNAFQLVYFLHLRM